MTEPPAPPRQALPGARTPRPPEDLHAADPFPCGTGSNDTDFEADREAPPSTPRWVKAFGIIALVLILLFVGVHLTGNAPTHTPASGGTEHGMQAP
jgi:hypothetical protein